LKIDELFSILDVLYRFLYESEKILEKRQIFRWNFESLLTPLANVTFNSFFVKLNASEFYYLKKGSNCVKGNRLTEIILYFSCSL